MSKKILAIIGLRSGSKGLKNKNIKKLAGKPLFVHILETAKKSKLINRIIISTDSKKYKKIINKYGGEAPYLRPKKYAKDNSPEIDFIKDLLNSLKEKENYVPDIVVRLLATCPLQKARDIDSAIKLVLKKNIQSSVIISKAKQHPAKALRITGKNNQYVTTYFGNNPLKVGSKSNRQQFPEAYFRANVLVCKKTVISKYNSLSSKKIRFIKIPFQIDIDYLEDFKYADYMIKKI